MSAPWAIIGVIFFMQSNKAPPVAPPEDQAHTVESTWEKFVKPVAEAKEAAAALKDASASK
jgi:hypothetical protein